MKLRVTLLAWNFVNLMTYWGWGGVSLRILTLVLDEGEVLASRSGRFNPNERTPVSVG
jgi:hypothetical protein